MSKTKTIFKKEQILGVILGVIIAYAITAISLIATAIAITYTNLQETAVPAIVMITCVIAVTIAGFDASRKADKNGWIWGMAAGGLYAIILICIITWAGEGFTLDTRKIMLTLLSIIGGGLGGIIGINFKK